MSRCFHVNAHAIFVAWFLVSKDMLQSWNLSSQFRIILEKVGVFLLIYMYRKGLSVCMSAFSHSKRNLFCSIYYMIILMYNEEIQCGESADCWLLSRVASGTPTNICSIHLHICFVFGWWETFQCSSFDHSKCSVESKKKISCLSRILVVYIDFMSVTLGLFHGFCWCVLHYFCCHLFDFFSPTPSIVLLFLLFFFLFFLKALLQVLKKESFFHPNVACFLSLIFSENGYTLRTDYCCFSGAARILNVYFLISISLFLC